MGSNLSIVVVNMFIEAIETVALDSSSYKPKISFCHVGNTFIIVICPRNTSTFNNQHSNIKFTMEIENNNSLLFLHVLVKRFPNGRLDYSVYRKSTYTDRYLNANSHHHLTQTFSVVNSLFNRVF